MNFKDKTKSNNLVSDKYKYNKEFLLFFCNFLIDATKGTEFHDMFLEVQNDLISNKFRVGVVAEVSRGKSTTINAILGEEILQKGTGEATTRVITVLTKPTKERTHKKVFVEYKSKENITKMVAEACSKKYQTEKEINFDNKNIRKQFSTAIKTFSDEKKVNFINYILDGWEKYKPEMGTEKELSLDASDKLIHNEKDATFIKKRTIYYDHKFLNMGIDIVDTPGIGSINERHDRETEKFVKEEADAIIFITYPKELMSKNVKFFLKNKITVEDFYKKGFFLINQIGELKPSELKKDYGNICGLKKRLMSLIKNELQINFDIKKIEVCDSRCALHSKIILEKWNSGNITKKDCEEWDEYAMTDRKEPLPSPEKNLDASNFILFENSFLSLKQTILSSYYDKIIKKIETMTFHLEKEKNHINENKVAILEKQKKIHFARNNLYNDIKILLENIDEEVEKNIISIARKELNYFKNKFKNKIVPKKLIQFLNIKSIAQKDFYNILNSFNENHYRFWESVKTRLQPKVIKQAEELINEKTFDVCFLTTKISTEELMTLNQNISNIFKENSSFWDIFISSQSVKKKKAERFEINFNENIEKPLINKINQIETLKKNNIRLRLFKVLNIEFNKVRKEIGSMNMKTNKNKELQKIKKIDEIITLAKNIENNLKLIAPLF